jgi:hypothetical protein
VSTKQNDLSNTQTQKSPWLNTKGFSSFKSGRQDELALILEMGGVHKIRKAFPS